MEQPPRPPITRDLARYAVQARYADLPAQVQTEAVRAFLNWFGCVLGGCHELPVEIAVAAALDAGGAPQSSIIGHGARTDRATAAYLNCFSSSLHAFDDTHLATVTHPTGPVAAGLLAFAETAPISGRDFLAALVIGMELECRMSDVLLLPPAQANLSLYITGVTGPIGAAAALGRVLDLDLPRMTWAISLAAAQASGLRATHGSMTGLLVPALAARNGVAAALLAARGFSCSENILEAANGFVDTFAAGADFTRATAGLGTHFEMLSNAYKPYPAGIVIHAAIDACLDIAARITPGDRPADVGVTVHPLTLTLTNRPAPATALQAMISLQHWVAAALLHGEAGLAEMRQDCIDDPDIAALRAAITVVGDAALRRDEAIATVTTTAGVRLQAHIAHASGGAKRPMSDAALDAKFIAQAQRVVASRKAEALLKVLRGIADHDDVARAIHDVLES
jgi:2-methylcitrate dehydratase PrpD